MAYPTSSSSERDLTTNPEGTRLYNPYQDLQLPSRRLYSLPTSPEFLFAEEAQIQRRSWGENLTYYTGIAYLSGSTLGASQGLYSALKATEPDDTLKLRINRILNSSGHSGRKMGNRIGCIGLIYAGLESGVVAVRDKDDVFSSLAAGLGTGVIYKAAAGLRSAAVGGAIGSVVAGILVAGKQVTKRYVPI